jgi:cell fate regulator YaaT (PSP1 superfamily)
MSCSSGSCGTGGGCSTKTGGCSSGGCSSGGCNKLNSFDWLGNMELDTLPTFDIIEIRFKNGRKEFFRNSKSLELFAGDPVVVEVQSGHHIGYVSMQGEIVRLQMKKKEVLNNDDIKTIYRKATQKDLEKFEQAKNREASSLYRTREIIVDQKLGMKLSDVEFQADNTKVTFYYSAEDRVDFRELIKMLAGEFKVRIEMKQISLRHEAARLGGIGSCGRELCCSTWLTDFKNVNTSAARYQNLSLNPSKLSGQCGRLKCCLNYELDTYLDALKGIPELETPLKTSMGNASLQKTDIFKRIMWFGFQDETNWFPIPVDRVIEIIEMNKAGKTPATLESNEIVIKDDRVMIREKEELSRFDDKFKSKNKKKKKKRPNDDASDRTQRPVINKQGDNAARQPRTDSTAQNSDRPAKQHTITPRSERTNTPNKPGQAAPSSPSKNDEPRNNNQNRNQNNRRNNNQPSKPQHSPQQTDKKDSNQRNERNESPENRPASNARPQRVSPNPSSEEKSNVGETAPENKQPSQTNRPQRVNSENTPSNKSDGNQRPVRQNSQPTQSEPKQENKGGGKHPIVKKEESTEAPKITINTPSHFPRRQNSSQHPSDGSSTNTEK